jgi:hypothetical protein
VYLEYRYQIVPRQNTHARPIDEGVPPVDLPVHHANATQTLRMSESAGLLDGVGGAVARSALFGAGIGLLG